MKPSVAGLNVYIYRGRKVPEIGSIDMFKTTKGLILREVRYKEADKILTVLTEDIGKITVKARGALRKSSKAAAATQLFAFSELTLFENKGRWTLNEGSTVEEFKGLRNDISALALASYFAECTEALSDEDRPNPYILQLILNSLFALSNNLYDQTHIKTAFELRLMALSGYEPDLYACNICGNTDPAEPRFSPQNGIIICRECRKSGLDANVKLCRDSLSALRYILHSEPRKLLSYKLEGEAKNNAAYAAETYLLTQTERKFSALNYWRQVK